MEEVTQEVLQGQKKEKKRLWTPEMEYKLVELNSLGNMSDRKIGLKLGGLTKQQVYDKKRTLSSVDGKVAKRKNFALEEDDILIKYCKTHCKGDKSISWSEINKYLPRRSIRQCRDRWLNYLSPDVSYRPWAEEEDEIIIKAIKESGPINKTYSVLGKQLDRSAISVKNHYYKTLRQVVSPNKLKTMEQQLNVNRLLVQEVKIINEAVYDINNNLGNISNKQEQNNQIQNNAKITLPPISTFF